MTWRPALWLVALAIVVIDQVTKQLALANLEPYVVHPVLGDALAIQLVFNSGAAFSLGNDTTWILTIVAAAVTVGIVFYARRAHSGLATWIFGIGLGGALGNLIDRLLREPSFGQGHVVDMINYNGWFVGNVADIAIVGAAAAVLLMGLFRRPVLAPDEPVAGEPSTDATSADATVASAPLTQSAPAEPSVPSPSEPRG